MGLEAVLEAHAGDELGDQLVAVDPTSAISRDEANFWAWAFSTSWQETVAKLRRESVEHDCRQRVDDAYVLWTDKAGKLQTMFTMIADATRVAPFREVYKKIIETDCPLTYVFVLQGHEGNNRWDIHRLSAHDSYLSHNWALWERQAQRDPAAGDAGR